MTRPEAGEMQNAADQTKTVRADTPKTPPSDGGASPTNDQAKTIRAHTPKTAKAHTPKTAKKAAHSRLSHSSYTSGNEDSSEVGNSPISGGGDGVGDATGNEDSSEVGNLLETGKYGLAETRKKGRVNNLNEMRSIEGGEAATAKTAETATNIVGERKVGHDGEATTVKTAEAAKTATAKTAETATVKAAAALLKTIKPSGLHPSCLEELAAALGRVKSLVSWLLCETTRVVGEAKTDLDAVDMLKKSVRLSGKEAKQVSKVSKALPEMPNAARGLAEGEITLNHAASLASAAEECGAEVVDSDGDLLKHAANTAVDRFARLAREFASKHSEDRGESSLDRQRRQRRASVFTNEETGMGILSGEFDPVSFNLMQQTIDSHTRALWQRDGGLDGKPDTVRSHKQRLCDAVFELITGRDAATHDPLPVDSDDKTLGRAKAAAQLIVLVDIGVLDGTNPLGRCEVLGTGRVPTDILRSLSPDTELTGLIFDGKSRPLWLGRSQRLANAAQRLALAVRDGGCVLCDEPMHRCQIHHIREWNTEGGKTDLENLATLCGSHHRWLHNHGKRLEYIHESGWKVCDRKTEGLSGARGTPQTRTGARQAPQTRQTPQTRPARQTKQAEQAQTEEQRTRTAPTKTQQTQRTRTATTEEQRTHRTRTAPTGEQQTRRTRPAPTTCRSP